MMGWIEGEATSRRCVVVPAAIMYLALASLRSAWAQPGLPGDIPIPVAVPVPVARSAGAQSPAEAFAETLRRALRVSGRLEPVSPERYPTRSASRAGARLPDDLGAWSAVGALLLVGGEIDLEGPQRMVAAVRLYDVFGRRTVVARRYLGAPEDAPRMARRFADAVLEALTGERGPFDSRILFVSRRDARVGRLWTVAPDGGDPAPVTAADDLYATPAWGGGPAMLLVTWFRRGTPDLFIFDLRAGRVKQVAGGAGLHLGARTDPTGRRIAVAVEDGDGQLDIVLLGRDGSFLGPVTRHPAADYSPSWSPDGRRLVFVSDRAGSPQLHVLDVEAGGPPERVPGQPSFATDPEWSPDGTRIAFTGRIDGRSAVFTIAPDGSALQRITGDEHDASEPSWSPDGRYLALVAGRPGDGSIAVVALRSGTVSALTDTGGGDSSPSWSGWLP